MDLMDGLENGQALGHRIVVAYKSFLVRCAGILGLQLEDLGLVVVSVELVEDVVLVSEHAASAIHAGFLRVEGPAVFGLEHIAVAGYGFIG